MPQEVRAAKNAPPPLDPAKLKMLERARAAGAVIAPEYEAIIREREAGKTGGALMLKERKKKKKMKNDGDDDDGDNNKGKKEDKGPVEEEEEEEFDATFTEEDIVGAAPGPVSDGGAGKNKKTANKRAMDTTTRSSEEEQEMKFNELLAEKGIHAFSRYEKEVVKLQGDVRFEGIQANKRRELFEKYCSTAGIGPGTGTGTGGRRTGKEENDGKEATTTIVDKKGEAAYRALLQERITRSDIRWHTARDDILASDDRFTALAATPAGRRRQEDLFRSHIDALRRAEDAKYKAMRQNTHVQRDAEQRKRQAGAADAERQFSVLLTETIKDTLVEWREAWEQLQRDPQRRASSEYLDRETAKRLFYGYLKRVEDGLVADAVQALRKRKLESKLDAGAVAASKGWEEMKGEVDELVGDMVDTKEQLERVWREYCASLVSEDAVGGGGTVGSGSGIDPAYARTLLASAKEGDRGKRKRRRGEGEGDDEEESDDDDDDDDDDDGGAYDVDVEDD